MEDNYIKHRQRDKNPGLVLPVFYYSCDHLIVIPVLMDKQVKTTSQMITIRGGISRWLIRR